MVNNLYISCYDVGKDDICTEVENVSDNKFSNSFKSPDRSLTGPCDNCDIIIKPWPLSVEDQH